MIEAAEKADSVPKYVRQAIKALEKAIAGQPGEVVDAELSVKSLPLKEGWQGATTGSSGW